MNDYVTGKGGNCLSKEYINESSPLIWRCEKGHTWDADFQIIRQGGWCTQCLKREKICKDRLQEMKKIAVSKGGKCLSSEYIDMNHKLDWQCAEGHKWSVSPTPVFYHGTWCRICSYKKNGENARGNIQTIRQIALKHNGKCLSENYGTGKNKLNFVCSQGHYWATTPSMIKSGRWCKICANKKTGISQRISIEEYKKIAAGHGGKLLSEISFGNDVKLKWQCSEGHQWYAKPNGISRGIWCKICGHKKKADKIRDNLDTFLKIATEKGGKCLSTEYIDCNSKLEFQCQHGHKWKASPITIKNTDCWCSKCGSKRTGDKLRSSLAPYINIALKRGGKCLSIVFTNNKSNLEWECALGHRWAGGAKNVLYNGAWCPVCARKTVGDKLKDSIETYQEIAIKHGGKCLSTEYINQKTKLEFVCAQGHIWKAAPSSIKYMGCWCRTCSYKSKAKK